MTVVFTLCFGLIAVGLILMLYDAYFFVAHDVEKNLSLKACALMSGASAVLAVCAYFLK